MVIGEAPGYQEDQKGIPFIGPAGDKLNEYLSRAEINPDSVRITNTVRCFPQQDRKPRPPSPEEMAACRPWLEEEVAQVNPEVIITVGNTPLLALLGRKGITTARGRVYQAEIGGKTRQIIPTIHPASVLRGNAAHEVLICQDIEHAASILRGERRVLTRPVVLDTVEKVEAYGAKLLAEYRAGRIPFVAFDIETRNPVDSTIPFHPEARILNYAMSHTKGVSFIVPYRHKLSPFSELELGRIDAILTEVFREVPLAGHNMSFDITWLTVKSGIVLRYHPVIFDSILASRLMFANTEDHGLEYLATKFANFPNHKGEMDDILRKQNGSNPDYEEAPWDVFCRYAASDTDAVIRLHEVFTPMLRERGLEFAFSEIAMKTLDPFVHMTVNGTAVDREPALAAIKESEAQLDLISRQLSYDLGYLHDLEYRAGLRHCQEVLDYIGSRYAQVSALAEQHGMGQYSPQDIEYFSIHHPDSLPKPLLKGVKALLRKKLPQMKPVVLNPNSTPCKHELVFGIMGITPDPKLKTDAGAPSLDKMALWAYTTRMNAEALNLSSIIQTSLRSLSPAELSELKGRILELRRHLTAIALLQKYMKVSKTISSFYAPMVRSIEEGGNLHTDGYVHPTFKNSHQETGRSSCVDPSEQNYPDGIAKKAFRSRWVHGLICGKDYSQHELRVAACLSGDPGLIDVFASGIDAHKMTASKVFKVPPEQVTKQMRSDVKQINFGLLFGMTVEGLAAKMGKSVEEAQAILDEYFRTFPGLPKFMETCHQFGRQHYAATTPTGRRRPLPEFDPAYWAQMGWSDNEIRWRVTEAERQAVNTPIQGGATDFIHLTLQRLDHELVRRNAYTRIWTEIHDSIWLDTHPFEFPWVSPLLDRIMLKDVPAMFPWATVPFANDCKIGTSWGNLCEAEMESNTLTVTGEVSNYEAVRERLLACDYKLEGEEPVELEKKAGLKGVFRFLDPAFADHPPLIVPDPHYPEVYKFRRIV